MGATGFFRGAGGAVTLMDVPTDVHAAERFQQLLDKGELVPLDESQVEAYQVSVDRIRTEDGWVDVPTMGYRETGLPDPVASAAPEPEKREGRKGRTRGKPAAVAADEPDTDDEQSDAEAADEVGAEPEAE